MTGDTATIDQRIVNDFDGDLRFRVSTVHDNDGDSMEGEGVDVWDIDVRAYVPHATGDEPGDVSIGHVVAYTIHDADDLDVVGMVLDEAAGNETIVEALCEDDNGLDWDTVFGPTAELSGQRDLLVIDQVTLREPFRVLPELLTLIVSGIRLGPAGRQAAFVVAEPAHWDVAVSHTGHQPDTATGQLLREGFRDWADTGVLVFMNADPDEMADMALIVMSRMAGIRDDEDEEPDWSDNLPFPIGARGTNFDIGGTAHHALHSDARRIVPMPLPPDLTPEAAAGIPDDLHGVREDEATGSLIVETHDLSLEVVGTPGNAPQLVGTAADADEPTQNWLREIHTRYWTYMPALRAAAHDRLLQILNGTLPTVGEDIPHVHIPGVPFHPAPWPGIGTIIMTDTGTDDEVDVIAVHEALPDGTHGSVGAIVIHPDGLVQAFLHDDWAPTAGTEDDALAHLATLGAREYLGVFYHQILDQEIETVILTGDTHER